MNATLLRTTPAQALSQAQAQAQAKTQSRASRDAARQLETLVHEAVATGTARQVLLLRLSTLPRAQAQPHHLRLAIEALQPLTAADRARLFVLPNHDAAIVWRGPAPALLADTMRRLSTLFAGPANAPASTLASIGDANLETIDTIARHLALPEQADLLLAATTASLLPAPPPIRAAPSTPLDPAALATLERALARADLSRFARRRPVCTATVSSGTGSAGTGSTGRPGLRLAWEMRLFSLAELAETLAPDRDLKAEPWLFRRLTRTLDQRMMALLSAPQELDRAGPFGLALNIASILSPAFLRFDTALPTRLRGKVVIALRPEDLLADPPAFLFARGFAHARGYRLMLTGITPAIAGAFPPEATGIDHLQLTWQPNLAPLASLGLAPAHTILAGVATTAALDWARSQSIPLLTGPLIQAVR